MKNNYLFFLCLFHFIKAKSEKIITINYFSFKKGYTTHIGFSEPASPLFINLNIGLNFTAISDIGLSKGNLNSLVEIDKEIFPINGKNQPALKYRDTITLAFEYKIENFKFYHILNEEFGNMNSIGLGYKFRDLQLSFLHQLKNKNWIDELSFTFGPEKDDEYGDIYFGGIPDEIIKNKKSVSLKVKEREYYWGTNLQYIYIGQDKENGFEVTNYSYFQSNNVYTRIPQSFFSFLNNKLFMNYIMKSECVINQKDNLKQFRCNCEIVKTFPHISFVIDGYIFELDRNNLFFFDSFQKCFFTMETDTNDVTNDFILGISFYKTNYISFNYEKDSIEIYSKKTFSKLESSKYVKEDIHASSKKKQYKYFYIGLSIILLFMSSGIFLVKKFYINRIV